MKRWLIAVMLPLTFVRSAYALTDIRNIDEPGRNPWQQTVITSVGQGDCISGLCIISFRTIPAGKRLVVTYASVVFDGSTGLGSGIVDAYLSDLTPGVPGAVVAQIPGLTTAGKSYQAGGAMTLFVDGNRSPVIVIEGASQFRVIATVVGYLIAIKQ